MISHLHVLALPDESGNLNECITTKINFTLGLQNNIWQVYHCTACPCECYQRQSHQTACGYEGDMVYPQKIVLN